ncbi:MAG: hypothetical protein P1P88_23505 [Bacteroidales bacterium]|nr:hypothetical protein [Bacteroidales bacterium]
MEPSKIKQYKKKEVTRVLLNIFLLAFVTYLLMIAISPNSKALPRFLIGFALIFVIIVLIAMYLRYIYHMYRQIKNNTSKSL